MFSINVLQFRNVFEYCFDIKKCSKGFELLFRIGILSYGAWPMACQCLKLISSIIWVSFCRTGKWANFVLKQYFWVLHCDQTVQLFQLLSTVLKRFCPLQSKNSLVLVLAHFLTKQFLPILPPNCDFWQFLRSI